MSEPMNPTPSPEDNKALEELKAELEKLKEENTKLKGATTSASAEASKYKKELQARMSEQEKAAAETKELIEKLKSENDAMKRSQTITEHVNGFLELGFDAELAKKAAESTVDGNFPAMKDTFKAFIEAHDKAMKADALRNTPRPGAGDPAPAVTKEQFNKMTYMERKKIYEEQPELYKELVK